MAEPAVHLLVFSRARPLQLHGMLTSVVRHWQGRLRLLRVSVLVRSEPPYDAAYRDVRAAFPWAHWCREEDFPTDLAHLLVMDGEPAPYTCFGCDDVVYTAAVDALRVADVLRARPGVVGYSLRLGQHTRADMFGREMPAPPCVVAPDLDVGLLWDAEGPGAVGDWAYPWEVLGTVYRTPFVRRMVATLVRDGQAGSPSHLEHHGAARWRECAEARSRLAAPFTARLVVPTVNVVQTVFGNGIVGPGMSPEFLLDCWHQGLRLDVERYRGMAPPSWRIGDLYLKGAAA